MHLLLEACDVIQLCNTLAIYVWIEKVGHECIEHGNHHDGETPVLEVDVQDFGPVEFLEYQASVATVAVPIITTAVYLNHLSVVNEIVSAGRYQRDIQYAQKTIADTLVDAAEQYISHAKNACKGLAGPLALELGQVAVLFV